jgi:hypothetical protein
VFQHRFNGNPRLVVSGSRPNTQSDAEDADERLNRELIELLNELRVALPGVQVLFAFLLTIPFSSRFPKVSSGERYVFFAAFLLTTLATALLIAPSAYHRLRWRQHDKERMLRVSNSLAIGGMTAFAAAMCCALYVVSELLFGLAAGILTAVCGAATFAALWYALPLSRGRPGTSEPEPAPR